MNEIKVLRITFTTSHFIVLVTGPCGTMA